MGIYIYMCVCVCIHTYIIIYTYSYTYIHTTPADIRRLTYIHAYIHTYILAQVNELLEKLKAARELALKAKKEGKQINEQLGQYKKETFSEKIDQVETYKKLKEKVDDEVKKNEIVLINKNG